MFIKGVNLDNWLSLEKWMEPKLFSGFEGEDELDPQKHLRDLTDPPCTPGLYADAKSHEWRQNSTLCDLFHEQL